MLDSICRPHLHVTSSESPSRISQARLEATLPPILYSHAIPHLLPQRVVQLELHTNLCNYVIDVCLCHQSEIHENFIPLLLLRPYT